MADPSCSRRSPASRRARSGPSPTSTAGSARSRSNASARTHPRAAGPSTTSIRLNDHEDRLYELVDGILVEKTVGLEESYHRREHRDAPQQLRRSAGAGTGRRRRGHDPARYQPGADSRRVVHLLGASAGRRVPRGADPAARPRPGRGGHQPEQHPQGDGREAPGVFREGRPPGLVRAAPEPGGRRLHGAGPLHPADGLDAARRRRRPAGFLGPGRRAVRDAEAAGAGKGEQKKNGPRPGKTNGRRGR